jgi:AP endonuclease 1
MRAARTCTSLLPIASAVRRSRHRLHAVAAMSSSSSSSSSSSAQQPPHLVGYHASAASGVWNAVLNAAACGAKAFAFFTRSSRTWTCPPLKPEDAAKFRATLAEHGFPATAVLPHGTYLSNCGAPPGSDVRAKSLEALQDELRRCAALGLHLYNFHPGSATGCAGGRPEACANVAAAINECHAAVPGVTIVIETMAAQGSSVGSTLEEVAAIIAGVADKSRVGVCVDTAHIHGAGYDVRTVAGWGDFMAQFEKVIGLQYLKGAHLNDSKVPLGSKKDRHWNVGKGFVGIELFRAVMNDPRLAGVPLILETPPEGDEKTGWRETYTREIALLYSLQGTAEGDSAHGVKPAPWARGDAAGAPAGGDDDDEDDDGDNGSEVAAGVGGSSSSSSSSAAAAKKGRAKKAPAAAGVRKGGKGAAAAAAEAAGEVPTAAGGKKGRKRAAPAAPSTAEADSAAPKPRGGSAKKARAAAAAVAAAADGGAAAHT